MRLSVNARHLLPPLLLWGCLAAAFLPALSDPQHFPFVGDAGKEFIYAAYAINALAITGDFPLWNPFNNSGEPFFYNHCWQGVYNPLMVIAAQAVRLVPALYLDRILFWLLLITAALLAWAAYGYFLGLFAQRHIALAAAFLFAVACADVANSPDLFWTANAIILLFFFLERWWRDFHPCYLWALALAAGIYATRANVGISDSTIVILLYLAVRLPRAVGGRVRTFARAVFSAHAVGAGLLFLILLAPKILIAREAAANVYRLGSDRPAAVNHFAHQTAASLRNSFIATDAELVNVLIIFVPFAVISRRSRPFFLLLLLVLLPILFPAAYVRIYEILLPRLSATGHLPYFYIFERAAYLCLTVLGGFGLRVILRAGSPRGGRAGTVIRLGALLLWTWFLWQGVWQMTIALLPGLVYVAFLWPRPGPAGKTAARWQAWLPLILGLPLLELGIPNFAAVSSPAYLRQPVMPYIHATRRISPGYATPPEILGVSELLARPLLTRELSLYGNKWRTRTYNDALRRLGPEPAARITRLDKPVFYLAGEIVFVNDADQLWQQLISADTPALAVLAAADREEALPATGAGPPAPAEPDITSFSPDRVEVQVASPTPALLVYADGFDPRWQVTVNRIPAKLLQVNAISKGVTVPAGPATVLFHYKLPLLSRLLWISTLLQLAGIPLLFLIAAWRPPTVLKPNPDEVTHGGSGNASAAETLPARSSART